MKKINLKNAENALSRKEMRTIMAGSGVTTCNDWRTKTSGTCYNCCITVYSLNYCASTCMGF